MPIDPHFEIEAPAITFSVLVVVTGHMSESMGNALVSNSLCPGEE
jgi:hypothetical protein